MKIKELKKVFDRSEGNYCVMYESSGKLLGVIGADSSALDLFDEYEVECIKPYIEKQKLLGDKEGVGLNIYLAEDN